MISILACSWPLLPSFVSGHLSPFVISILACSCLHLSPFIPQIAGSYRGSYFSMIVLPDRQNREMVVTLPPCLPASPFICLPSWSAAALSPFICPPFMISILACCWVRQPPCLSSFVTLYSLSFVSQCWFLCPPPPASPFIAFHLVSSFFGNAIWGLCLCNFWLFYWNLYFLFTCLLKPLLSLYFSIETCTFSLLFDWSFYILCTFLLKSVYNILSLYFSVEISTFSLLFFLHLYWLFTFLLKSLLYLYFSFGISTQMYGCTTFAPALHCEKSSHLASPNVTTHYMCACTTSAPALHCEKQSCLAFPNGNTYPKTLKKNYAQN